MAVDPGDTAASVLAQGQRTVAAALVALTPG